jgi:glycosyltransferase involved in cell wall biosynthesis
VESLLIAWGQMPERDQFRLDVAGAPWNRFELMELIRRNGLYRHVFVHGFVSDTKLSELLDRADLGINLRYPSMGEASGSLLRMWEHALAAMVTKVGWYSALPADCVAFVEQQRESEDIQRHLRDFAAAPEKYAKIGLRGHHRVINRHTPQQFAEALLRLTGELNQQQLAREIHGLAARVAGKIRGLEPEHMRGGVSTRVAKHLDELFGDQTQEPG